MKTMMKIDQIWNELLKDKSQPNGLLFRRYSGTILPDIYIAIQYPENLYCFYITINKDVKFDISSFSKLKEIEVLYYTSPNEIGKKILLFKLLNKDHKDIFALLCEDLISSISEITNEDKIVLELLNRFEKWKSLLTNVNKTGLSPDSQRGLFGELYLLRKFLNNSINLTEAIVWWVGAEKEVRDFQSGSWAIEVKTSHGNNHQKVMISSERQLDNSNLENLYLYHISLEKLNNSDETLNQIIDSIKSILSSQTVAFNKFLIKIFEAGYLDIHRELYDSVGYQIRGENYYKVENDFPRICERDIPMGVGDIKYSIIMSQCDNYIIEENLVFNTIIG